ncbi:hypothetical protein LguiA_017051 [Lonicera macranthoides]
MEAIDAVRGRIVGVIFILLFFHSKKCSRVKVNFFYGFGFSGNFSLVLLFRQIIISQSIPSSPSVTYLSLHHPPFLPLLSVTHLSKPQ